MSGHAFIHSGEAMCASWHTSEKDKFLAKCGSRSKQWLVYLILPIRSFESYRINVEHITVFQVVLQSLTEKRYTRFIHECCILTLHFLDNYKQRCRDPLPVLNISFWGTHDIMHRIAYTRKLVANNETVWYSLSSRWTPNTKQKQPETSPTEFKWPMTTLFIGASTSS